MWLGSQQLLSRLDIADVSVLSSRRVQGRDTCLPVPVRPCSGLPGRRLSTSPCPAMLRRPVVFKVETLVYQSLSGHAPGYLETLVDPSLSGHAPGYLVDDCQLVTDVRVRQIRSADT